jgi:hypothetical protein
VEPFSLKLQRFVLTAAQKEPLNLFLQQKQAYILFAMLSHLGSQAINL